MFGAGTYTVTIENAYGRTRSVVIPAWNSEEARAKAERSFAKWDEEVIAVAPVPEKIQSCHK